MKGERDRALTEVARTEAAAAEERDKALKRRSPNKTDSEQGLKTERDRAFAEVAKLTATVEGLSRARPDAGPGEQTKRWLGPIAVGIVLLAAVAGAFVSLSPGRKADGEAGAKFAELTATVTKSDKARQDAEAKADQATAALTKSDKARQDAEAKADQATAALTKSDKARQDAEAKATQTAAALAKSEQARQAAEAKADAADKARQAAEAKAATSVPSPPTVTSGASQNSQFSRRSNAEARGIPGYSSSYGSIASVENCEQPCARSNTCKAFTYGKQNRTCYLYTSSVDLVPNEDFDSGMRNDVTAAVTSSPFTLRRDIEATPPPNNQRDYSSVFATSVDLCEQSCTKATTCNVFTYNKKSGACIMYRIADLVPNEDFDSGIRN